ncbi:MAG: Gfo/Idh/MocA family oxidoreductase [Verrucomicrobiae bacterium]|nr:Gfo/Idh/MocA family oxidoreductase [Verrucomicrobiae bacterium]
MTTFFLRIKCGQSCILPMKSKIKVAFIGAGNLANLFHYPSLAEMKDVELVAISDLVPKKLAETANKYGIAKQFADFREMLDKVKCDAVYAIMPPHHVFDVALEVLNRGKHLFIEKPPGLTHEQCRHLWLAAERKGCITQVGFQRRHAPLFVELKRRARERGMLHQIVCTFYKNHIGSPPYYGGAIDILTCDGIHAVDMMRWLADSEPQSVASHVRALGGMHFDSSFNTLIKFQSGCDGVLLLNWACGRRFLTMEAHANGISTFGELETNGRVYADNKEKPDVLDPVAIAGSSEQTHVFGFYQESRHFIDCIRNEELPISHLGDALKTMELVQKIYASQI